MADKKLLEALYDKLIDDSWALMDLNEKLQNSFISNKIYEIKKKSDSDQLTYWSNIKNTEIQDYLFETLDIEHKLEFETCNNILYFLNNTKNPKTINHLINNSNIVEVLIKRERLSDDYDGIKGLSNEVQKQIFNSFENSNHEKAQESREELLEVVNDEIFLETCNEIPSNKNLLIRYYALTGSAEAKESLLAFKGLYMKTQFEKIVTLYPSLLSDNDFKLICESVPSHEISSYIRFNSTKVEQPKILKDVIKSRIIDKKEPMDINFRWLKNNIFNEEKEIENYLNNSSPMKLLILSDKEPMAFECILKKLKTNPDYLRDIGMLRVCPNYPAEQLKRIFDYLKPETAYNLANKNSYDFILKRLKTNPEYAQYIYNEELISQLAVNINADSELYYYLNFGDLSNIANYNEKLEKAIDGFIEGKRPLPDNFYRMYNNMSLEQKNRLIEGLPSQKYIMNLYLMENNRDIKEKIFNKIIKYQDEILIPDENLITDDLSKLLSLPQNEISKISGKLNNNRLFNLYETKKNSILSQEIIERFKKNPYLFNNYIEAEKLIYSMRKDDRDMFYKEANDRLHDLLTDNKELYDKLMKNKTVLNLKVAEAFDKGLFNDKIILDKFNNMLDKNPFLISTLDIRMLDKDFININDNFIEKVSKYPELQQRIIKLKEQDTNFTTFKQILSTISTDDNKIFDRKVLRIVEAFENNNIDLNPNKELTTEQINNLERYILINSKPFQFSKEHMDLTGINPLDLNNEIIRDCDNRFNNATSIIDMRNIFFQKYFDMTYSDAMEFLRMYDNNMNGVDINPSAFDFINNVKSIISIDDPNSIKELYNSHFPKYTINDIFEIENSFQQSYTSQLANSMFNGKGNITTIQIDGKDINAIEPTESFKILTHSTNAYFQMPMIDNDYYKSWNMSSKTNNHGICTACISDKSLGLPPLNGDGCIFGFTEFSKDSITNIAPYDLCSVNSEYVLRTARPLIYTSADDLLNQTRHSHNECVLERKNLLNNDTINIQPQYVIITSEMDENQKSQSLKAAKEMNPPEGLPLIYLDIEKLVAKNKSNIETKVNEFTKTGDIKIFKEVLSDYESTRCTLRSIDKYDFIDNKQIDQLITNYIDYCDKLSVTESRQNLESLVNVLSEEKRKFDLIEDSGNRFKAFDIDYNEHMKKIYEQSYNFDNSYETDIASYHELKQASESINTYRNDDENSHLARIALLSQKIGENFEIDQEEKEVLIVSSLCLENNIKPITDEPEIEQTFPNDIKENQNISETVKKLSSAIIESSKLEEDFLFEKVMKKYDINPDYAEKFKTLCEIVKDARELDKVRNHKEKYALNPNRLNLEISKCMLTYAEQLYNASKIEQDMEMKSNESGFTK